MKSGAKTTKKQRAATASDRLVKVQRLVLAVAILAAALLLFPGEVSRSQYEEFEEGKVAPATVVAPFDFDVRKPDAVFEAEKRRARDGVASYFRRDETVAPRVMSAFDQFAAHLEELTSRPDADTLRALMEISELGVELSDRARRALLDPDRRGKVLAATRDYLETVLEKGLADQIASERIRSSMHHMLLVGQTFSPVELKEVVMTLQQATRHAQEISQQRFADDPVAAEAFRALTSFAEPNIRYDRAETRRIQDAQVALITPIERRVLKDEMIVEAHRILVPDQMRALEALKQVLTARDRSSTGWKRWVAISGRGLLTAAILVFAIVYLRLHRPRVYAEAGKLTLLAATTIVVFALASIVLNVLDQPWLLIPVAAGSMVVSLLVDAQLGVFFTLVSVVVVAFNANLGLDFVSGSLIGGFTGVYSVQRVRHRSEIFRALLLISMAYVFTVTAQGMMRGDLGFSIVTDSGWGVLNALVSTAIALFLIPVLEMTCRVTTDLTLLELSDLNRPLLRRLMLEAPGTYHHSMVMGTMSEAGCEAVGANSLLGRVQCYYHDIGKISKPEYFIENIALNPRGRNPHDRLTPSMSCLILESHVREGVALAKEHKLPEPLIDAIREHHGTSEMSFFYEKAKAIDPSAQRDEFRYPGPRPRSKETAIVMLADGVEAASRVLTDPRPSRIRQLVNRIVEARVESGELAECGLTLADLEKIRRAFVHVLTGMFHGRVRYPTDTEAATAPPGGTEREEGAIREEEPRAGREKHSGRAAG